MYGTISRDDLIRYLLSDNWVDYIPRIKNACIYDELLSSKVGDPKYFEEYKGTRLYNTDACLHPTLFAVLVYYKYDVLKFILDNWRIFYISKRIMISEILRLFYFSVHFSTNLPVNYYSYTAPNYAVYDLKSIQLLVDFCNIPDIIKFVIYTEEDDFIIYDDGNYYYSDYENMEFINRLV